MTAYSEGLNGIKEILNRAIEEQKRENDSVYLVCGVEGSGKSTLVLNMIEYVDQEKQIITPIEAVGRNLKELVKTLRHTPNKRQIALDEGSELSSDLHYSRIVKSVRKMFTVMRQKSLIVYLCFTNPARVNTYFREDRVKGVFIMIKRTLCYFYTKTQFLQILEYVKRNNFDIKSVKTLTKTPIKPALISTKLPDYNGILKEDYKKQKEENIQEVFEELYQEFGTEERTYSLSQGAKYLKTDRKLLVKYLKTEENPAGIIPVEWNLSKTKYRIKEDDLIRFKAQYEAQMNQRRHNSTNT